MSDTHVDFNSLHPDKRLKLLKQLQKKSELRKMYSPNTYTEQLPLTPTQTAVLNKNIDVSEYSKKQISLLLRLRGPLNIQTLKKSFLTIIDRHQALRTVILEIDKELKQEISPISVLPLSIINLQNLPLDERGDAAMLQADKNSQLPFNLETGPLLRTSLYKISDTHHTLLLNIHCIISDDWSAKLLVKELTTLYDVISLDKQDFLPKLSIQYGDFIRWQRNFLKSSASEKDIQYWASELKPPYQHTSLQRRSNQTPTYDSKTIYISNIDSQVLKSRCQNKKATLSMGLLSIFFQTLHTHTHCSDLIIKTLGTLRNKTEFETLFGHLTNPILIRCTELTNTFYSQLSHIKKKYLSAMQHQGIPETTILSNLREKNKKMPQSLHHAEFYFLENKTKKIQIGELEISPIKINTYIGKSPLNLVIKSTINGLACTFLHDTHILNKTLIELLAHTFFELFNVAINKPNTIKKTLPILSFSKVEKNSAAQFNTTFRDLLK